MIGAVGGLVCGGCVLGVQKYAIPHLTKLINTTFTFSAGLTASASGAAALAPEVVITGKEVVAGTAIIVTALAGLNMVLMSKPGNNPVGTKNNAPYSWTNKNEGLEAMKMFNGDLDRATKYILENHGRPLKRGAGNEFNIIKKWLSRIIRKAIHK